MSHSHSHGTAHAPKSTETGIRSGHPPVTSSPGAVCLGELTIQFSLSSPAFGVLSAHRTCYSIAAQAHASKPAAANP
jgi:hypothetical protein